MKVIIAGNRNYYNYDFFKDELEIIITDNKLVISEIVSGGSAGIDTLAERYAKEQGISIKIFPAEWGKYGKAAGPFRNRQMAKYIGEDGMLIAFWDYHSSGTRSMIRLADEMNIRTIICSLKL